MTKITAFILIVFCYVLCNLIIAAEGQNLASGKFKMPKALRRIMFYLPRNYYKFTKRGIVLSICSHVWFVISVIVIFLQQDKWHGISDALFYIWLIGIFALLIVYAIGIYGGLLFGEKRFIKNDSLQSAKAEIVEFGESEIITEAIMSKTDVGKNKGLMVMIPAAVTVDCMGTFTLENCEDAYVGTYGNYEQMSAILNEEGYATVRFNLKQSQEYGFFDYVNELKKIIKAIMEKAGCNSISFFAHGPIGSVTVFEVMDDFKVDRLIVSGGANVTPYEDLRGFLKFSKEKITLDELIEMQPVFGKEILSIKENAIIEKFKKISFPTLVIFGAEELVYNCEAVERMEAIDNKMLCVEKFLNLTGVWINSDLSRCQNRVIEIKKNRVLNVSKNIKNTLKIWLKG